MQGLDTDFGETPETVGLSGRHSYTVLGARTRSRPPQRCDLSPHPAGLRKAAEPQGEGPALPDAVNSGPPPPVRKSGVEDTRHSLRTWGVALRSAPY